MANQALAFLADNYCILTNVHGNLSELILEKVNKIEFSENYIERKYRMMAGLAYHSGDLEKALQLYALVKSDKCLQLTPENPRVHILKARILADLRCRHEAMNSCIHAIQYSYGWDKEILDQINAVIQRLNNAETKK